MAAAPAIVRVVGGRRRRRDRRHASRCTRSPGARASAYQIPALGFRGTPLGIDCREVVHTGVLPFVNTGIAHREPGVGQIGAGLVKPPDGGVRRGGARRWRDDRPPRRRAGARARRRPAASSPASCSTAAYLELDGFVVAVTARGVPLMPNGIALTGQPGSGRCVGTPVHLTAAGLRGRDGAWRGRSRVGPLRPACQRGPAPSACGERGEAILRGAPPTPEGLARPAWRSPRSEGARALLRALADRRAARRARAARPRPRPHARGRRPARRRGRRRRRARAVGRRPARRLARRRRAARRAPADDDALGHAARARRARARDRAACTRCSTSQHERWAPALGPARAARALDRALLRGGRRRGRRTSLPPMNVLDLSQDFSCTRRRSRATTARDQVGQAARLRQGGRPGDHHDAARRHPPRRARALLLRRQVHRRPAARLAGRPGLRGRPRADGPRRLRALRPRALRALGARHRADASSPATS